MKVLWSLCSRDASNKNGGSRLKGSSVATILPTLFFFFFPLGNVAGLFVQETLELFRGMEYLEFQSFFCYYSLQQKLGKLLL